MFLKSKKTFYLLPLLIPYGLFAGGVVFTLLQSFYFMIPGEVADPLLAYKKVLTDPWVYSSFAYSFYIALVSTVLSIILGFFIAFYLWRLPLSWQKLGSVYKVNLILPHITVAYFVLLVLSQRGVLATILLKIGMIDDYSQFPLLVFDSSGIGIITTYVLKESPFVALLVYSLLGGLSKNYLIAAKQLGAGLWQTYNSIILPHVNPAFQTSFFILFLYSFGAFEVPFLLGASKPEMLSVIVYNIYYRKDFSRRPEAMVILVFLLAISGFFIFIFHFFRKKMADKSRIL